MTYRIGGYSIAGIAALVMIGLMSYVGTYTLLNYSILIGLIFYACGGVALIAAIIDHSHPCKRCGTYIGNTRYCPKCGEKTQ